MHRQQRSRGQHQPLHALLPAARDEGVELGEVPELRLVDSALRAHGQLRADLRDHDTDLARRHLHPRELLDAVDRPELEAQSRLQQLRLVSGLAVKRDRVLLAELAEPHPPGDQSHFGRTDRLDRRDEDQNH